jgi:hypothetical protein
LILILSCRPENHHDLHLNDIQIIGSHNSHKKAIDPELMLMIYHEDLNLVVTLDYEHLPITEQLDLGMRNLKLDLFYDPEGGKYTTPLGIKVIESPSYYDTVKMRQPGFKVFHIQDVDFRSHYYLFSEALKDLKKWSDVHPDHIPVIINIHLKDEVFEREGFVHHLPFTEKSLDSMNQEITTVIGWDQLIQPDWILNIIHQPRGL